MNPLTKQIFFLGFFFAMVLLCSCSERQTIPTGCAASDLLLEESVFPNSVVIGDFISPLPEGTKDSAGNTVYFGKGFMIQDIYPFSNERAAVKAYEEDLRDPVFTPRNANQGWPTPDGIDDFSFEFDNYRLACGIDHSIPMCRAILLHGSYYVFLNVHTYEDDFSHLDFLAIVQEYDRRLNNCISN